MTTEYKTPTKGFQTTVEEKTPTKGFKRPLRIKPQQKVSNGQRRVSNEASGGHCPLGIEQSAAPLENVMTQWKKVYKDEEGRGGQCPFALLASLERVSRAQILALLTSES